MLEKQFTFAGFSMPSLTMLFGAFLMIWALMTSLLIDSKSMTAWIPAIIGCPILMSGFMCILAPSKKKVWMHIALTFGVLSILAGMDFFRPLISSEDPFGNLAGGMSKLMLFLTGIIYVFTCARSFIWARRNT